MYLLVSGQTGTGIPAWYVVDYTSAGMNYYTVLRCCSEHAEATHIHHLLEHGAIQPSEAADYQIPSRVVGEVVESVADLSRSLRAGAKGREIHRRVRRR